MTTCTAYTGHDSSSLDHAVCPLSTRCRDMGPALALSILDPRLTWSEAEGAEAAQRGVTVMRGDGSALDPYDLKRLQVG